MRKAPWRPAGAQETVDVITILTEEESKAREVQEQPKQCWKFRDAGWQLKVSSSHFSLYANSGPELPGHSSEAERGHQRWTARVRVPPPPPEG